MPVASHSIRQDDPVVQQVVDSVAHGPDSKVAAALIVGPPGFGKTSVLRAAALQHANGSGGLVLWVPGGVVASDRHLARMVREALGLQRARAESGWQADVRKEIGRSGKRLTIAVDDFDELIFKREKVALEIVNLLSAGDSVRLFATARPGSADRITGSSRPFFQAMTGIGLTISTHHLLPLGREAALALVHRRVPRLPLETAQHVAQEAGGHPAALVYLARLAEMTAGAPWSVAAGSVSRFSKGRLAQLFGYAAEFAGTVYAETWAGLGPQQRAIVWELARQQRALSAAEIASALDLPPSHVSAQLTRLVADALVKRGCERSSFEVTPLIARWVLRRGTAGDRRKRRTVSMDTRYRPELDRHGAQQAAVLISARDTSMKHRTGSGSPRVRRTRTGSSPGGGA